VGKIEGYGGAEKYGKKNHQTFNQLCEVNQIREKLLD